MATALSSMATARKAKKPIMHFGVKGQKKFVSVLCCFLLHIDLFTHSADMMAQGPSSHLYSHSTHGMTPILAYWALTGIDPGTKLTIYYHRVPVPFWDRHPGSGASPPNPPATFRIFGRD